MKKETPNKPVQENKRYKINTKINHKKLSKTEIKKYLLQKQQKE